MSLEDEFISSFHSPTTLQNGFIAKQVSIVLAITTNIDRSEQTCQPKNDNIDKESIFGIYFY